MHTEMPRNLHAQPLYGQGLSDLWAMLQCGGDDPRLLPAIISQLHEILPLLQRMGLGSVPLYPPDTSRFPGPHGFAALPQMTSASTSHPENIHPPLDAFNSFQPGLPQNLRLPNERMLGGKTLSM